LRRSVFFPFPLRLRQAGDPFICRPFVSFEVKISPLPFPLSSADRPIFARPPCPPFLSPGSSRVAFPNLQRQDFSKQANLVTQNIFRHSLFYGVSMFFTLLFSFSLARIDEKKRFPFSDGCPSSSFLELCTPYLYLASTPDGDVKRTPLPA